MVERSEEAYREHMKRRQAKMEDRIAKADVDRGVVVVLTGPGKGKSSSAFGMVARAVGHGFKVGIVYFIKSRTTGEQMLFKRLPEVDLYLMGEGFTWNTQDRARDRAAADKAWQAARAFLADSSRRLVVLDELNVALKHGMIDLEPVLEALDQRPAHQHVIITGRSAPEALIERADTVSEVRLVKHAFKSGVRAQQGVEL